MPEERRSQVALIIPLFNEEAMIPVLVQELERFRGEREEVDQVIFVDDGSRDNTVAEVQRQTAHLAGYHTIRLSRNFGHQMAISAGIEWCTSEAAIIMDADLQDPLSVAGKMIDQWKQGYDVVYGVRGKRSDVPASQRITAHWFYRIFRSLTDVDAPVDTGDFRLISRDVMDAFNRFEEQQPYVRGLIAWLGFNQIGVEYDRPGRVAGDTKYPFKRRFKLALAGLTSFSSKPLKLAVNLGLFISAGSFLGLIWVLVTKYVLGTAITGWASLIFAAFFFGGVQLFFLGIVGTYVARVYDEVKRRPRFVIRDVLHSGNQTQAADTNKRS
jgi:glycosyltransferase involved in cell wall biosynthesis